MKNPQNFPSTTRRVKALSPALADIQHGGDLFQKTSPISSVRYEEWKMSEQDQKNTPTPKPRWKQKQWNFIPKHDRSPAIWTLSEKSNVYSSPINPSFATTRFQYRRVPRRAELRVAGPSHRGRPLGAVTQRFVDTLLCLYVQTHGNGFLCACIRRENTHQTGKREESSVKPTLEWHSVKGFELRSRLRSNISSKKEHRGSLHI